jgi:hypothetical protein
MAMKTVSPLPRPQYSQTTSVEWITPEEAEAYLTHVHPNQRVVRPRKAAQYAEIMRRGDWVLSPDGISFDTEGRLIQGCHRLSAVILFGGPVLFTVTRNVSQEAFHVLDQGVKRQSYEALGVNRKVSEIASTLNRIANRSISLAGDVDLLRRIIDRLNPELEHFWENTSKSTLRGFPSSMRTAAFVRYYTSQETFSWVADKLDTHLGKKYQQYSDIDAAYWRKQDENGFNSWGVGSLQEAYRFVIGLKVFDRNLQGMRVLKKPTENELEKASQLAKSLVNVGP